MGGKTPAKVQLKTLEDLDGRTGAAQKATRMRDAILADLGGAENLSTLEQRQALHAALDAAILEDMHTRWLAGQQVSITEMVTVSNCFNRTAAALGVGRRAKPIDWAQYAKPEKVDEISSTSPLSANKSCANGATTLIVLPSW